MQKGTIIYVGNFELPDKNAAAHRVMNNGKIFKELGYTVAYLSVVRDVHFDGVRQSDYCKDIYEEAYPIGTKQWVNHLFDTNNILKVAQNYDDVCLVIAYNTPFVTYKALKKAFAKKGVKVAYDCTEWNSYAEGSLPKRLYKKIDEKQIRNKLSKKCDDIIVISKLMEKKYKGANLLRLPPLVDLKDEIWQQKRESNDGVFEFCFAAGSISNKEKLDVVVKCFSQLQGDNLRFRIVGLTKEEYLKAYPEHKSIIENDRRIIFMGMMTHKQTVKNVLSCDCYIFVRESTTRTEAGFPTKFAEACSCGVPIISTNVSDIKEFADSRIKLLDSVSENKVLEAMAQAIDEFDKNSCLRDSFDYRKYVTQSKGWLEGALK